MERRRPDAIDKKLQSVAPVLIRQGAEAKLYRYQLLGRDCIIKERFSKCYRHPDLDKRLTLDRLRAEVRILQRCRTLGIHTPQIYHIDKFRAAIYMQYLHDTLTVRELIDQLVTALDKNEATASMCERQLSESIGRIVATLHKHDIIHGDLTSSNILIQKDDMVRSLYSDGGLPTKRWQPCLYMIDFGLSFVSNQTEDKGVDLYVLERALLSSHSNAKRMNKQILDAYKHHYSKHAGKVLAKLSEVRARGRKRDMIG